MYSYSGHEDDDDSVRFEKPSRHGDADDDDLGVELDSPDTSSRRSHQGSSSTNSSIRFENSPDQEYSAQVSIIMPHFFTPNPRDKPPLSVIAINKYGYFPVCRRRESSFFISRWNCVQTL